MCHQGSFQVPQVVYMHSFRTTALCQYDSWAAKAENIEPNEEFE